MLAKQGCAAMRAPECRGRAADLHGSDVINLDQIVPAAAQEPVRVGRRPRQAIHGVLVRMQVREASRRRTAAGSRVPQFDELVLAAREEEPLGRVPLARFHVPSVALQAGHLGLRLQVPDGAGLVVAAGGEVAVARREGQVADRLFVCFESLQIVQCRLPVFHHAALVAGEQQLSRVRPLHGADGLVVRLRHDALEVELQAVPVIVTATTTRSTVSAQSETKPSCTSEEQHSLACLRQWRAALSSPAPVRQTDHMVNSPVCDPVISLRPSGVQHIDVMGARILLTASDTYLVQIPSAGLWLAASSTASSSRMLSAVDCRDGRSRQSRLKKRRESWRIRDALKSAGRTAAAATIGCKVER